MTTKLEKSIMVNVPVSTAYNQWTQFEEFPQFMSGVKKVTQLGDDQLEWVAEILGVRRRWTARILEQVPDHKVAWAATEGATNAGAVTFKDAGGGQTSVHLSLEYEPQGILEGLGDKLHIVEKQAEGDLERFKAFIESEGYATGAWRGSINQGGSVGTPGVEQAAASPAQQPYPPVEPVYRAADEPVTPTTTTGGPLPSPGTANTVYPTEAVQEESLSAVDPDLESDWEARRRGGTFGGGATPPR